MIMVYGLLKRYLGLLFLSACIIPNLFAGVTQKKEKPVMFQVRKDIKYQVIDNFGASCLEDRFCRSVLAGGKTRKDC